MLLEQLYYMYYNTRPKSAPWGVTIVCFHPTSTQLLNIATKKNVGPKFDGLEHPNVRYYVDVFTNVNDNPKTSILEYVCGLSIDIIELSCGMRQAKNSSIIMQDAPSLINLQNALTLINLLFLPHLLIRRTRRKKSLVDYN